MSATLDLDAPSTIEEQSYRQGYAEGEEHGALHGMFEGRQLGVQKGFELWQELGQIEAVARVWLQSLTNGDGGGESRKRQKLVQQLELLIALVDDMPMDNRESVDMGAAMERIRAKYKLASLSFSGVAGDAAGASSQDPQRAQVTIKGRQVDASQLHF